MFLAKFKRLSVFVFYGSDPLKLENVQQTVNSILIFILGWHAFPFFHHFLEGFRMDQAAARQQQ